MAANRIPTQSMAYKMYGKRYVSTAEERMEGVINEDGIG
jgi:hypothetical protein